MTEKYRDECADYWREKALAPTCQEERDAVNKGPEGEGIGMKKDHRILEIEMSQMKALADEMYMRYWSLREQYDQAWREFVGDEYADEGERMRHARMDDADRNVFEVRP